MSMCNYHTHFNPWRWWREADLVDPGHDHPGHGTRYNTGAWGSVVRYPGLPTCGGHRHRRCCDQRQRCTKPWCVIGLSARTTSRPPPQPQHDPPGPCRLPTGPLPTGVLLNRRSLINARLWRTPPSLLVDFRIPGTGPTPHSFPLILVRAPWPGAVHQLDLTTIGASLNCEDPVYEPGNSTEA